MSLVVGFRGYFVVGNAMLCPTVMINDCIVFLRRRPSCLSYYILGSYYAYTDGAVWFVNGKPRLYKFPSYTPGV